MLKPIILKNKEKLFDEFEDIILLYIKDNINPRYDINLLMEELKEQYIETFKDHYNLNKDAVAYYANIFFKDTRYDDWNKIFKRLLIGTYYNGLVIKIQPQIDPNDKNQYLYNLVATMEKISNIDYQELVNGNATYFKTRRIKKDDHRY